MAGTKNGNASRGRVGDDDEHHDRDFYASPALTLTDLSFDMNGDGSVDLDDITEADVGWLAVGGANNPMQTNGNPFLIGDANLDGVVDGFDLLEWNGSKFQNIAAWCSGDFNADGVVDGLDFNEWNSNKFMSSDQALAVPEPHALMGLLCGLVTLLAMANHWRFVATTHR